MLFLQLKLNFCAADCLLPKPDCAPAAYAFQGFRCAQTSAPGETRRNLCYPSTGSVVAASPPCDAVAFSGCAAPEGCSPAADSSTWAASTAGASALLRPQGLRPLPPLPELPPGFYHWASALALLRLELRGACKLALLDALVDDDGEIAAGGVDDRRQTLRR